jgi:hypothetical protein
MLAFALASLRNAEWAMRNGLARDCHNSLVSAQDFIAYARFAVALLDGADHAEGVA